ncbi:MAG: hypothetical protein N2053_07025 [Chitinispirillaceae bacterium]|nr:hypothetical protein [Chitinispirillaceae bacterium]
MIFSLVGSYYFGIKGIFLGRLTADILAGIVALVLVNFILSKIEK